MGKTERLSFINQNIKRYGRVSTQQLIDEFEVSDRTVRRDIEELKYMLNAPIHYDRGGQYYFYNDDFEQLDFFDDKLLLFYSIIKAFTSKNGYVPIKDSVFDEFIENQLSKKYLDLTSKIDFHIAEFDNVNIEFFYKIFQSFIEHRALLLSYTDNDSNISKRVITPQKLINYSGSWYLLAFDLDKKQLRLFNLSRFSLLNFGEILENFEIDKAVIEGFLHSSFGIFKSETSEIVTLKFYGTAANIVKNQTWQESQISTFDEVKNELTLSIKATNSQEIIGKVLKFGSRAEIVSPENVRESWKNEIRLLYDQFIK